MTVSVSFDLLYRTELTPTLALSCCRTVHAFVAGRRVSFQKGKENCVVFLYVTPFAVLIHSFITFLSNSTGSHDSSYLTALAVMILPI